MHWFQIRKGVHQGCHPAYLTYVQSTSCEMPGWMKHKLGSGLLGEISINSDMQIKEISPGCSLEGLRLKLKLPILWPPDAKSLLLGKDPDSGKD